MGFEWIDFYMEFADRLLEFKDDRSSLIEKVKEIYSLSNIKMPKLEKDNEIIDIDPFTIFGIFNKSISHNNRLKLISSISEIFNIKSKSPEEFDGVPVLMNLNSTFYRFKDLRNEDDIDNLWELFEYAIRLSDNENEENLNQFIKYFNKVRAQYNTNWKTTIGLFWIRPYYFINLDSRNRWYILNYLDLSEDVKTYLQKYFNNLPEAKIYLDINNKLKKLLKKDDNIKSIPQLSYKSWVVSEEENNKLKGDDKKDKKSWYIPIIRALRELGGSATPPQTRERIIINEKLNEDDIKDLRGKSKVNRFENEVAFARASLVAAGYIDNSVHGMWILTDKGKNVDLDKDLDLTSVEDKSPIDDVEKISYWTYSPGHSADKWDICIENNIMLIGWGDLGDLRQYSSKEEIKEKMKSEYEEKNSYMNVGHYLWQFANELKVGDIIFAKKGNNEVIGRGEVISDYYYTDEYDNEYKHVREINWTDNENYIIKNTLAQKTLTNITDYKEIIEEINSKFSVENIETISTTEIEKYTKEDFLNDVFMTEEDYERLVSILKYKKNIILQGAPGVGKTYISKRLAYSIMGEKDISRVSMIQFHQSYSYEDFIMGYRPTSDGFELRRGSFYNFCRNAEIDSENDYFFIIDEINRGNLSKIFGEIFMLIENDKRGIELQLLYKDENFRVPPNVYIIGMMNTADRSLALLDYALRRRFSFFEIRPGFNTEGFKNYRDRINNQKLNNLVDTIVLLNEDIEADDSLGRGFSIGHSYLCNFSDDDFNEDILYSVVEYELIPLLNEYWFDEYELVEKWSKILRDSIK